jgi:hypothetical protein
MKYRCLFFTIFSIIIFVEIVHSKEISIADVYHSIYINDSIMRIKFDENNSMNEEYDVKWETVDNIDYINFDYTGEFLGDKIRHGNKRYLVLYNSFLIFYNSENDMEYFMYGIKPQSDFADFNTTKIEATSELKEGNIIYKAENLFIREKLLPWAEGVRGDGIGQKIKIIFTYPLIFGVNGLIISNGYIDYNRPYLYEYNNRIKKIKVYYDGYDEYKILELADTPQYQYINIGINYKPEILWIEIMEVYKGTKYDDTCINNIIPYAF